MRVKEGLFGLGLRNVVNPVLSGIPFVPVEACDADKVDHPAFSIFAYIT
jgi:hypothetical protein